MYPAHENPENYTDMVFGSAYTSLVDYRLWPTLVIRGGVWRRTTPMDALDIMRHLTIRSRLEFSSSLADYGTSKQHITRILSERYHFDIAILGVRLLPALPFIVCVCLSWVHVSYAVVFHSQRGLELETSAGAQPPDALAHATTYTLCAHLVLAISNPHPQRKPLCPS